MKQFLLVLLAVAGISIAGFTQQRCAPLNIENQSIVVLNRSQVGDFTIIDTEGNTLNLYNTLDEGKTVFLDLFFTTCSYCIQYAPIIEQAYQQTGAGQEDVLFWGISPQDNNAAIDAYKASHGISNPCAGTEGNGPAAIDIIIDGQNFLGYPTYCVVCPDKDMRFDICYPPTLPCLLDEIADCPVPLIPDFEPDTNAIPVYQDITFTDLSTGDITSWEWIFEGGNPGTSTEQNPVVTYDTVGVYDVTLTISDGTNSQTLTKEDLITVEENVAIRNADQIQFVVAPNPASETIRVTMGQQIRDGHIALIDMMGKIMMTSGISLNKGESMMVDIRHLASGIYFIQINNGTTTQMKKLVVE
jgi:PKD repeat protein